MSERTIYHVEVPEADRQGLTDTPEVYHIKEFDEGRGKQIIIYGKYSKFRTKPEWVANPSCRWLVGHLIGRLNELVELKEWKDSYDRNDDGRID